jgi:hypothetical protein
VAAATLVNSPRLHGQTDRWELLRSLVGTWEGPGSGFGVTSTVSHAWQFVLADQFLRLRTRSVSQGSDGSDEIHEDVGYLSRDTDRDAFAFRQFFSEGYVNTYDVTLHDGSQREIEFAYREAESAAGLRARMRLVFQDPDTYEMVLDLAEPGEEFVACRTMLLKRIR